MANTKSIRLSVGALFTKEPGKIYFYRYQVAGRRKTVSLHTNTRAELGDSGLFDRYDMLLRKHFSKYKWGTVHTAVQFMKPFLPAVDPVYAKVELTRLREMVAVVAPKAPEQWNKTLKMLDGMLASLK